MIFFNGFNKLITPPPPPLPPMRNLGRAVLCWGWGGAGNQTITWGKCIASTTCAIISGSFFRLSVSLFHHCGRRCLYPLRQASCYNQSRIEVSSSDVSSQQWCIASRFTPLFIWAGWFGDNRSDFKNVRQQEDQTAASNNNVTILNFRLKFWTLAKILLIIAWMPVLDESLSACYLCKEEPRNL